MADNSVTIGLGLDISKFNSSLESVKAQLRSLAGEAKEIKVGAVRSYAAPASSQVNIPSGAGTMMKQQEGIISSIRKTFQPAGGTKFLDNITGGLQKSISSSLGEAGGGIASMLGGGGAEAGAAASAAVGASIASLGVVLLAVLAILVAIAAALAIGVVVMEAIKVATGPIMKVLTAIGKVLGAALIPIAMVIVQLLRPLIQIMMPFIRIMNAIFAPLRTAISTFYKAASEKGLKPNDPGYMLGLMGAVQIGIQGSMIGALAELAKMIITGFALIIATLATYIGTFLAKLIGAFAELAYWIVKMIPFIGGESNAQAVRNTIYGFAGKVSEMTNIIADGAMGLAASATSAIDTMQSMLLGGIQALIVGMVGQIPVVVHNTDATSANTRALQDLNDSMTKKSQAEADASRAASDAAAASAQAAYLASIASVGTYQQYLAGQGYNIPPSTPLLTIGQQAAAGLPADTMQDYLAKLFPGTQVGDAVIRPGGGIVSTSPSDWLIATRNPGELGGSGVTVNVTQHITVQGSMDDKAQQRIVNLVKTTVATEIRSALR